MHVASRTYGLSVKQLVTIVACENGETQVHVTPPKKEYLLKLIQYIDEYQTRYGKKNLLEDKFMTSAKFSQEVRRLH